MPRFISEHIEPDPDSIDFSAVQLGEPGLPGRFVWRGETIEVANIRERWKEHRRDATHKSKEMYVYKHWFEIDTTDGRTMKLYFERRPRSKADAKRRWWLFSIV